MPNLPMHIYLANRAAEQLDWGYVNDHLGSCLLGSTAPDIRAMTKWDRQRTHFASLGVESVGVGTKKMFEQHPELADFKTQSPETRAFLLGYVSHLAADEVWITTMFRPYFGEGTSVTGDRLEGHLWDRALQLDMDRRVLAQGHANPQAGRDHTRFRQRSCCWLSGGRGTARVAELGIPIPGVGFFLGPAETGAEPYVSRR